MPAWSQDSLALDQRVDLILADFPTADRSSTILACEALLENGPEAWKEVISRLVPIGFGDDVSARYALSTLAKYLGAQEGTADREQVEKEFIQSINEQELALDVQAFLIDQLQYFGTNQSVSGLQEIVVTICEPVVATWNAIGTNDALEAMIKQVSSVMGTCKINLTKSIATYSHPQAIATLRTLVNDPDPVVSEIALEGLATNGDPSAYASLTSQAVDARGFERLIKFGNARGQAGDVNIVNSIAKSVMKSDQSSQIKSRALTMASTFLGAGAKKYLLKALKKGDEDLRTGAIEALSLNREIPLTSILKYYDKLPAVSQLKLLSISGTRNEPMALPYARKALQASDHDLQLAGIRTISSIQGRESFGELASVFRSTSDPILLSHIINELSRHTDASNMSAMLELLGSSTKSGKVALIEKLSNRGGPVVFTAVTNLLSSDDEDLRQSAFAAIPKMARSINLESLIGLLPGFIRSDGREELLQAIVVKIEDEPDPEAAVNQLTNALGSQNQDDALSDLLPRIGGRVAFQMMWPEPIESDNLSDQDLDQLLSWNGPEAIFPLIDYLASAGSSSRSEEALGAIIRKVGYKEVSAEQRYLILRQIWDYAPSEFKSDIVRLLSQSPTYPSLMWCSELMKEPEFAEDAAKASIQIALPSTVRPEGFFGKEVRDILLRSDSIVGSELDPYSVAILEKYLREMPRSPGFISMFNGEDLTGWQGLVDNPLARDTMFAYMLRQKQSIADFTMRENWGVKNGAIEFHGDGYDNLCSIESYRDFEFLADWKIEKGGDSGIYLRGSPQVQIWDPKQEDGSIIGSGGLYNNEIYPSQPQKIADNPVGHWNNFRILMIDDRVTVYLNGELVTDNVILENYWDRSQPIFREGPIELQAHTTPLEFRNIFVRPIEGVYDVPRAESFDGFKSLFNGINLAGWVGNKKDYVAENGEIVIYPSTEGGHGNLYTEEEYGNFVLRFQFKLTPGANNGLGVHAPLEGDAAYLGKELQILDNNAPQYASLEPWQFHGSLYGVMPAKRGYLKPVGEWNTQEVTFDGDRVKVVLNGTTILLDHIGRATREGTVDGKEHPGLSRRKGHIGFLGHGSQVHFRHIRIKELPDTTAEEDR